MSDSGWSEWAAAVQRSLTERGISVNAAAEMLGVRNSTLKTWLDGTVPPQLGRLPKVAEITGISHAMQLDLGGMLPASMRADAHSLQAAEELREAVRSLLQLTDTMQEIAYADAGARLAGILLSEGGPGVQVVLRRAYRGQAHLVHHSTYVGVQLSSTTDMDMRERERVSRIVGDRAVAFSARWREQLAHDWPEPRPQLVLTIPQHERPRAPGMFPVRAVPSVLFIGCPYGHAEFVAASLADALDYGYRDVRYNVPLELAVPPTHPGVTAERTRWALAHLGNGTLTDKYVWALADHRVLPMVEKELVDAELPLVVYVRSGDLLLARGGEVWNIDSDEVGRLRETLDRVVREARWPALVVEMPDEILVDEASGRIDRNLLADASVAAAADVWNYIYKFGMVPNGRDARGHLAGLFDDQGRVRGGPRRSLVSDALRMPPRRKRV